MIPLLDVAFQLLQAIIGEYTGKLPVELVASAQAAVDAWAAHKNDVVTQANLEAQRS